MEEARSFLSSNAQSPTHVDASESIHRSGPIFAIHQKSFHNQPYPQFRGGQSVSNPGPSLGSGNLLGPPISLHSPPTMNVDERLGSSPVEMSHELAMSSDKETMSILATEPRPLSQTLLPAFPISPPQSGRVRPDSGPSPPKTPSLIGSPLFHSPRKADHPGPPSHPWNTPGPSIAGSSVSPAVPIRFRNATIPDDSTNQSRPSHPTPAPSQRDHNRSLSRSPGICPPPSPPHLHSPYRQSYARGNRNTGDEGSGGEDCTAYGAHLLDTDDDFLRNVQRIEDSDASIQEDRTPSPFPDGPPIGTPSRISQFGHHLSPRDHPPPRTPPRPPGGEIDRLRAEKLRWELQRRQESEPRRPEYLRRWGVGEESPGMLGNGSPGWTRRPKTRGAIPQTNDLAPVGHNLQPTNATRLTRARDAKDAEAAIAAVRASLANSKLSSESGGSQGESRGAPKRAAESTVAENEDSSPTRTRKKHKSGRESKQHASGGRKDTKGKGKGRATDNVLPDRTIEKPKNRPKRRSASPAKTSTLSASETSIPARSESKTQLIPGTGVGIAVSPVKGRRIKLMRAVTPPAEALPSLKDNEERMVVDPISPTTNRSAPPTWYKHGVVASGFKSSSGPHSSTQKPHSHSRTNSSDRLSAAEASALLKVDALGITIPPELAYLHLQRVTHMRAQEKASKKRKRMAAFLDADLSDLTGATGPHRQISRHPPSSIIPTGHHPNLARPSPLKPAIVDGLGRMAINPNDLEQATVVSPFAVENRSKLKQTLFGLSVQQDQSLTSGLASGGAGYNDLLKHVNSKTLPTPAQLSNPEHALVQALAEKGPRWPDAQYPWSLSRAEQTKMKEHSKRKRMEVVEHFFDRDTDDESDDRGSAGSNISLLALEGSEMEPVSDDMVVEGARGLWALGHASENGYTTGMPTTKARAIPVGMVNEEVGLSPSIPYIPSFMAPNDPSDARSAFASRRDVRSSLWIAQHRNQTASDNEDGDEGEVVCVCRGPDDGRAMVRCDGCHTWSHQVCVDIEDESLLGETWFCWQCLPVPEATVQERIPSPVLAQPIDLDQPFNGPVRADTFLGAIESTPQHISNGWTRQQDHLPNPTNSLLPPKTPNGHSRQVAGANPQSNWLLSPTVTPNLPARSRDGRLLRTPRFFDDFSHDDRLYHGLDPTSTPSRGTKYSVPFVSTSTPQRPRLDTWSNLPVTPGMSSIHPGSSTPHLQPSHADSASTAHSDDPRSPPSHHYSMSSQYMSTPTQKRSKFRGAVTGHDLSSIAESPIIQSGSSHNSGVMDYDTDDL